jgi:hypothetical protein
VGFENRLPGGNAEKKYGYKIIEMFFRIVRPQIKADSETTAEVTTSSPHLRKCIVLRWLY